MVIDKCVILSTANCFLKQSALTFLRTTSYMVLCTNHLAQQVLKLLQMNAGMICQKVCVALYFDAIMNFKK